MSTIVYRISVLLGAILTEVSVGTNLGLFWLLWALISGRFLLSRGAVFPALADGGLPADAVRRAGAALAYGCWAIAPLGCGLGVWTLGHPNPRAGVPPGGPAGRPLARPWLGRVPPSGL